MATGSTPIKPFLPLPLVSPGQIQQPTPSSQTIQAQNSPLMQQLSQLSSARYGAPLQQPSSPNINALLPGFTQSGSNAQIGNYLPFGANGGYTPDQNTGAPMPNMVPQTPSVSYGYGYPTAGQYAPPSGPTTTPTGQYTMPQQSDPTQGIPSLSDLISAMSQGGSSAGNAAIQYAQGIGGDIGSMESYLGNLAQSMGTPQSIMPQLLQQLGNAPNLPTLDIDQMVKDYVSANIDPQEQAARNMLQDINTQYNISRQATQGYGSQYGNALQNISNALQATLGKGQQNLANIYGQAGAQTGQAYDTANQNTADTNAKLAARLQQSAQGLGYGGAAIQPTQQLNDLMTMLSGVNSANQANALSSIANTGANAQAFQQDQMTGAARQGAQSQYELQQDLANQLAQMSFQNSQDVLGQNRQIQALEAQRPILANQERAQLISQQYQMQRQAQADRLAQLVGLGNLDISSQNALNAANKNLADIAGSQATLAGQGARAQATVASRAAAAQPTMADIISKAAAAQSSLTNTAKNQQAMAAAPPTGGTKPGTFYENALDTYLNNPSQNQWGAGGAGPIIRNAVSALIQDANNAPKQGAFSDPYQTALNILNTGLVGKGDFASVANAHPNLVKDPSALLRALSLYYTGR
jgi:hypothetical protein